MTWSIPSMKCSQMKLCGILLHRSLNHDTNRPKQEWPEDGQCVLSFCWGSIWPSWLLDGLCHQLTPIDRSDQVTSWGCLRCCQSSGHVAVGDHFVVQIQIDILIGSIPLEFNEGLYVLFWFNAGLMYKSHIAYICDWLGFCVKPNFQSLDEHGNLDPTVRDRNG